MAHPKLICCQVMVDELRAYLPAAVEVETLEISLHTHPEILREKLQEAIDRADEIYDPIYLGYGLCGNAVVGLVARKSHLVIFKNDDCIGIFLGSHAVRKEQLKEEAGTLYLTHGWIGDGEETLFFDLKRLVGKYGEARAEKMAARVLRDYKQLVYIRMPNTATLESDREYARRMADRFHLQYKEVDGTSVLLERLARGDWNRDDFIVTEPSQTVEQDAFFNLMR